MADPLACLQEYALGKRELHELKNNGKLYYVFGDNAYPHDAKTNLGVYNKQDEYYTIESILLFWKMRELQHTAYVRDVSGRGIASITRVQRRDLLDFLNGGALPKEANMLAPIPPPIPAAHLQQDEEQNHHQSQQHQQHSMHSSSSQYEPERKKPRMMMDHQQQAQHDKKGQQRIDKILDKSSAKGDANAAEVRGLSSALPAEKVAQLRSRVKNNLKNKPLDEESFVSIAEMAPAPSAGSDAIGRFIAEKERTRKDRTTCLESSRDFSAIAAMVKDLYTREGQAKSSAHPHQQTGPASSTTAGTAPPGAGQAQMAARGGPKMPMASGYSRYDQEIFQKETVADFEIETDLSFHGNNALNQQMNKSPAAIHPSSTATIPNGVHPRPEQRTNGTGAAAAAPNVVAGGQRQQQKRVSRTPIIIIPSIGSTLITMFNANDILQDLRFVSSEEKKRSSRRENELLLQIQKNGATVPYRVIDNPTKLKEEEWDRVVAVFVQGPAWQFKGWKWNGNPVEIFSNVAAFHLKFEEQKLDPNVAKWSVNVLSLSRTKRHLDRAILQKFWEILDRHIAKSSKREWLRY